MKFSELVHQRRTEKKISIFDLSLLSGVMTNTIRTVEGGKGCHLSSALKIGYALGIASIPTDLEVETSAKAGQEN